MDAKSDSWHTSQDPPSTRLKGQAVLTPIVMTKLERIEKVIFYPYFFPGLRVKITSFLVS